jgi:para-aminobenzoate synthetase/4-amino-4-deoxychorismate lyase
MSNGFAIYDALLWEPATGYFLMEYHLRRLERSAAHFGYPLDVHRVEETLLKYSTSLPGLPRKVRLELASDGAMVLNEESVKPSTMLAVALSAEPVRGDDEFLRHKTSRREVYNRALAAHPAAQDVLLWNERRELTETCHGNIVLEIAGRKLTPPVVSGLLPGVFRAHLLDRGEIAEQVLPVDSLSSASAIFMINSVRRWCPARLLSPRSAQC